MAQCPTRYKKSILSVYKCLQPQSGMKTNLAKKAGLRSEICVSFSNSFRAVSTPFLFQGTNLILLAVCVIFLERDNVLGLKEKM